MAGDTTAQGGETAHASRAAIAEFPAIVRRHRPVIAEHEVLCGMALGCANLAAPVNGFRAARAPVEEFATFLD